MNNRRKLLVALGASALVTPLVSFAQAQGKIWRIGFVGDASAATRADQSLDPFREGMAELGYVVGRNLVIEARWTDGNAERRVEQINELVRMRVDVLVTHGVQAGLVAKAATTNIPIVLAVVADMVGTGLVTSLAHPGGNITGMTDQVADLAGKEVQLLKETLPRIKLVAIVRDSNNPFAARATEDMQSAAIKLGLRALPITIRNAEDIDAAFDTAVKQKADAIIMTHTPLTIMHRARIARLAIDKRLPMMSAPATFADAGGLISYGPDFTKYFKRAAIFVDKILKGAKPADLPVEQPTKFELVVNMKTAKTLGIKFPQSILIRADKVIE